MDKRDWLIVRRLSGSRHHETRVSSHSASSRSAARAAVAHVAGEPLLAEFPLQLQAQRYLVDQ